MMNKTTKDALLGVVFMLVSIMGVLLLFGLSMLVGYIIFQFFGSIEIAILSACLIALITVGAFIGIADGRVRNGKK